MTHWPVASRRPTSMSDAARSTGDCGLSVVAAHHPLRLWRYTLGESVYVPVFNSRLAQGMPMNRLWILGFKR